MPYVKPSDRKRAWSVRSASKAVRTAKSAKRKIVAKVLTKRRANAAAYSAEPVTRMKLTNAEMARVDEICAEPIEISDHVLEMMENRRKAASA